jgi:hypothetical protein
MIWDPFNGAWVAGVAIDYFRAFGGDLREYGGGDEDDDADHRAHDALARNLAQDLVEPGPKADTVADFISGKGDFLSAIQAITGKSIDDMIGQLPKSQQDGLKGFSAHVRELSESAHDPDPFEPEKLFPKGRFKVVVRAKGKEPPADAQRRAWTDLLAHGDAVFDNLMTRVLPAYQAQRAARVEWWTRTYGADDPQLPASLPDATTVATLMKIIRPYEFRVHTPDDPNQSPAIGIHFDASWDRGDGFGVLLRDRQIVRIGHKDVALKDPDNVEAIDHPVFGRLTPSGTYEWEGRLRFEPFRAFHDVADPRLTHRQMNHLDLPRSGVSWSFASGEFDLEIHTDGGTEPTAAQADAFRQFTADPQRTADLVLNAILAYYKDVYPSYRESFQGDGDNDEFDAIMPKATSVDDLRELITFTRVLVQPDDGDEPVALGLNFHCSWEEEHGLGVRWRNGKVEEVGYADVAF